MKARNLLEQFAHGPESLKVLGKAFDDAWLTIAPHFGDDAQAAERARLQLAHAVLALANPRSGDEALLVVGVSRQERR